MKKISERVYVSETDERMIADVLVPGYNKDAVSVSVSNEGDENYFLKIKGRKVASEKFGFYSTLAKFKEKVKIGEKYDSAKAVVSYDAGILRVSVPVKDARKGVKLHPAGDVVDGDEVGESEEN